MLCDIYIEALLVDEDLADQVWEEWDAGELSDASACIPWQQISALCIPDDHIRYH